MLLVADVLMDPRSIGEDQRTKRKLQSLANLSMTQHHLQQLTENHSNLLLILMPASDILRNLATLRLVLLIKRTEIGMHVLALRSLLIFYPDLMGYVL